MTFRALARICRCAPVLGVGVPPRNGGCADFGSVSHNDNAHKSSSLLGALECS